uniref:Uncharacterized protein n=1 Tax=Nelumbo nucifera TaxID=4432 RepID=A0A822ZD20_NELNU|nr:TPA_asm: hypothetical protein HUJ06_000683 [Nelumbo nucifera]
MVKFHHELTHLAFMCTNIFGCIASVESCMMVVSSLVPNYMMGVLVGIGVIVRKQFAIKPQTFCSSVIYIYHSWSSSSSSSDHLSPCSLAPWFCA